MQSVNLKSVNRWKPWLVPCGLCVLLLAGVFAFGSEAEQDSGILRSRVYKFQNITSGQAQDLFSQLNIGKQYNTLSSDVLIVTSDLGTDLVKATEIFDFLDRRPLVQVRSLMTLSENNPAPPDAFFQTLGTITVGTMTESPSKGAPRPAIIDVVGDELIAIGTEDVLTEIQTALEDRQQQHRTADSTEKDQDVAVLSLQEQPQAEIPETEPMDKPEAVIELNTHEVAVPALEPAESGELVEPLRLEPPATPQASQASESIGLDELAQHVFESVPAADSNGALTRTLEKAEGDFLNEGLLEVLTDAEQGAADSEIRPAPEAVVAEAPENAAFEQTEEIPETVAADPLSRQADVSDALREKLKALLEQSNDEQQQTSSESKQGETPVETTLSAPPLAGEELKTATLQAELEILRQRLAELEAMATAQSQPAPPEPVIAEAEPVTPQSPELTKPIEEDSAEITDQPDGWMQTAAQLPPELAEEELETIIDLPQEVELEALIDLVGKQLGLNYMYDPVKLRGQKVQLKIHGGKIKVKDTYALLESVLRFKDFVMTRRGNLVTILPQAELAKAEPVLRKADEPIQPGDVVVSSLFELEHIDPTSAQNMLRGMNLGTNFTPVEGTNTLIVTDYAYRMDRIRRVLNMVDVAGEKKQYEFRTLRYMKPTEILPKLEDLVNQLKDVTLEISAPEAAQPQQTRQVTTRDPQTGQRVTRNVPISPPRTPAAAQTPVPDAVYIDTDDRTNRILIAGRQGQVDQINELIDALDVPQYDLKMVREYIIKHVEASEVVDVIEELALGSVSISRETTPPTTDRTARARAAAAARAQQQTPIPQPASPSIDESKLSQIYISIRPATNSLLVNATAEQHNAVELVVAHVDVVQKDQRTIRQYEIQYVDTQAIITTLEDLEIIAPQQTGYGPSSRTGRDQDRLDRSAAARNPNQPEPGAVPLSLPSATGGSEKDITAGQPQISVLETTNSLLVYATPRQHDAIALVIAHADRQLDSSSTPYVVYALENQDPLLLSEVLNKLIQETVEEIGKTSAPQDKIQTAPGVGQTAKLPTLEEQKIRVIPDEKTYSLIVYANKRNQQWLGDLIRELDEYRPQVLLDCTLVEITSDDDFSYAINVLNSIPDLTYTSGLTGTISGTGADTITKDDILNKLLAPASDRSRFIDLQANRGNFTGFYGNDKVMALLTAMQSKRYGRIMANPKLLVNDNEQGTIETKTTTYITRTTTNFQQTQTDPILTETTEFDPYDASIKLDITPRISKGDNLRLEITLNRSDFLNFDSQSAKPPDRAESDVFTVVTVPDGYTIILGGMDKVNQSKGGTKVPLLGDLPIVGGLFRSTSNVSQENKLYVFVKANILRPGTDMTNQDLKNLSNRYRIEFEGKEAEMQRYEDWPGIKPKPMKPVKVLEDDEYLQEIENQLEEMDTRKGNR